SVAQVAALVATLAAPPPTAAVTDVGPPVEPHVFTGDLRALPIAPSWKPAEPIREMPRRRILPEGVPPPPGRRDPLLDLQRLTSPSARAFASPELNLRYKASTAPFRQTRSATSAPPTTFRQ